MKYTNILIVTENYTFGGLETHLYGKIKHLSCLGYKLYLVTGVSYLEENLPREFCEKIYTGIDFSNEITAQGFILVTQKLNEIIKENNIEIIDSHPFLSSLPAFFSAALIQIPFIYTMHGPASILEGYGQFVEWFVKGLLLPNASLVNNVSEETYFLTKPHAPESKLKIFRNAVDITLFKKTEKIEHKSLTCCLVSRIDSSKVTGIKHFLSIAASSNLTDVEIYGDGPELNELTVWISENINNAELKVTIKGLSLILHQNYVKYSIVAGMGRVVLEAVSMNKPVVLVGYDGVKGLLDHILIEQASYANFSGRGLPNISSEVFQQQLDCLSGNDQPYLMADWVESNANESQVWNALSENLQLLSFQPSELTIDIYHCFVNHESNIPYISDQGILNKIWSVLCSASYINSAAYKLWAAYELRVSEIKRVYGLENAELIITSHFDQTILNLKNELIEENKQSCLAKDQEKDTNFLEIKRLNSQVLEKEIRIQENAKEQAKKDALIEELKRCLDAAQNELLEKELKSKEKEFFLEDLTSKLDVVNHNLNLATQKIIKFELQLKNQIEQSEKLKHELNLANKLSSDREKLVSEQEKIIMGFYDKILEYKHKTYDFELLINELENQMSILKVDNDWYKATFINRSILGVIKEKVFSQAFKRF